LQQSRWRAAKTFQPSWLRWDAFPPTSRLRRLLTKRRTGIHSFDVRMILTAVEVLSGLSVVDVGGVDGMSLGRVELIKYAPLVVGWW
jgi:hypothetical protein